MIHLTLVTAILLALQGEVNSEELGECLSAEASIAYKKASEAARTQRKDPSFLDVLVYHVRHEAEVDEVRSSREKLEGDSAWQNLWRMNVRGKDAHPFIVENVKPWWHVGMNTSSMRLFSCSELARFYGDYEADYQMFSTGKPYSSEYGNIGESSNMKISYDGEKLNVFSKRIKSCSVSQGAKVHKENLDIIQRNATAPSWFVFKSSTNAGAKQLWADLRIAGLSHHTPVYLEGRRFDRSAGKLLRQLYNDGILREVLDVNMPKDLSRHDLDTKSLIQIPEGEHLAQIFIYAGDKFSGTFLHQHGSGCSLLSRDSPGGQPRLWFMYSPESYCALNNSLPDYLPHRCPRISGNCIEGIHPLDLLQHYWELKQYDHAPILHLQEPGSVFCFPEGWFHGTLNLGPSISVAIVLRKLASTINFKCHWDDVCEGEDFDAEKCRIARQAFHHKFCHRQNGLFKHDAL